MARSLCNLLIVLCRDDGLPLAYALRDVMLSPLLALRLASERAKEGADVLGQQLWLLKRRKVTAPGHLRPLLEVVETRRPLSRRLADLLRKAGHGTGALWTAPCPGCSKQVRRLPSHGGAYSGIPGRRVLLYADHWDPFGQSSDCSQCRHELPHSRSQTGRLFGWRA